MLNPDRRACRLCAENLWRSRLAGGRLRGGADLCPGTERGGARKPEYRARRYHSEVPDIEIGGPAGQETLERIEHTFGRMEAVWKPVGSEEGFEVVRRRLFLPLDNKSARDDVCRAFGAMYRDYGTEFPTECREGRYLDRMKACYPIHPEVFDRLYGDWATLERFQRTRGVLRLMAVVIHRVCTVYNDASLLIMPGSVSSIRSACARS